MPAPFCYCCHTRRHSQATIPNGTNALDSRANTPIQMAGKIKNFIFFGCYVCNLKYLYSFMANNSSSDDNNNGVCVCASARLE